VDLTGKVIFVTGGSYSVLIFELVSIYIY